MTHLSVPPERKQALGITDNLVRVSIGVEDPDDLIADFDQALGRSDAKRHPGEGRGPAKPASHETRPPPG